jgi:tetratricopeptide (TPR) repeat protein
MGDAGLQNIESINRKLAPALIFAAVSVWFFQTFIMGSDMFWHLAAGRHIWENGAVPQTDPFSFTFGGKPWVNHEWLWDIVYWRIYQLGPDAVAWFTIGLFVAIFSMGYLLAYRMSGSVFASGLTVWFAAATCYWFLDIRPHVVTLLLVSVVLITRDKKWVPWMWPPLIILWTNLHAGFVFGIGMIGLLVLVRTLEASWEAKRVVIKWEEWLSVALCLLAWLVNPYGWRIVEFQFDYFSGDSIYKGLVEWRPPEFRLDLTYYEGSFWWFTLLVVLGIILEADFLIGGGAFALASLLLMKVDREKWRFLILIVTGVFLRNHKHRYLIALSGVAFILATNSRRFIPLFVIIAIPFAAMAILHIRDFLVRLIPALKSPWAGVGASMVALACATSMWSHVKLGPSLLRNWSMSDVYPEEALKYLKAIGPPQRVMNYYNWGGFIILHAPEVQLFIDGRANTLYDENIYEDYQSFLNGRFEPERLARYPAEVALLPGGPFVNALQKIPSPWKPIYRDWNFILLPPDSPLLTAELPDPSEVLKGGIQPLLKQGRDASQRGDNQQAEEYFMKALEINPQAFRVYGELSRLYALTGSVDKIPELIEWGIRENPRRQTDLRFIEGSAYLHCGKLQESLVAFKKSVRKGPFANPLSQLQRIKETERALDRKKRGY